LLRLRDVDLIHLHFPFYSGGDLVALGERLGGPPYVVTYHQDVELGGWLGRVAAVHDRTLGRLVLRRAARLCPTSLDYLRHSAVADLGAAMGSRVVPLPNGVDLERFRVVPADPSARRGFGLPPEGAVVLFVGAMDHAHHFKGVPTLLEALQRTPEASALLVGDGELRPDYERRAAALGIEGRVRFAGRIATDRLVDAYRAADVLVLPSVTRGEAFGMVLLEAMASGRPTIATDLPGVRSVVDPGRDGLLVPPGDAAALAAAIGEVAAMPAEQRAAMGATGRAKVERDYGWERIGDRLEALYDGVLAERSGSDGRGH
jgi:glycosyltransferase involved in cell wall biosynthesis